MAAGLEADSVCEVLNKHLAFNKCSIVQQKREVNPYSSQTSAVILRNTQAYGTEKGSNPEGKFREEFLKRSGQYESTGWKWGSGSHAKALRQEKAKQHWDSLTQEKGRSWGAATEKASLLSGGQSVKGLTSVTAFIPETNRGALQDDKPGNDMSQGH